MQTFMSLTQVHELEDIPKTGRQVDDFPFKICRQKVILLAKATTTVAAWSTSKNYPQLVGVYGSFRAQT